MPLTLNGLLMTLTFDYNYYSDHDSDFDTSIHVIHTSCTVGLIEYLITDGFLIPVISSGDVASATELIGSVEVVHACTVLPSPCITKLHPRPTRPRIHLT